jgi:hypothetical protein
MELHECLLLDNRLMQLDMGLPTVVRSREQIREQTN